MGRDHVNGIWRERNLSACGRADAEGQCQVECVMTGMSTSGEGRQRRRHRREKEERQTCLQEFRRRGRERKSGKAVSHSSLASFSSYRACVCIARSRSRSITRLSTPVAADGRLEESHSPDVCDGAAGWHGPFSITTRTVVDSCSPQSDGDRAGSLPPYVFFLCDGRSKARERGEGGRTH